jgi:hypothetical protein
MILNKRLLLAFPVIFFFLTTFGCVPKAYKHLELETRVKDIKTLGLAPPDIEIYSLDAEGRPKLIGGWCDKGKENIFNALIKIFEEKGIQTKIMNLNKEDKEEMQRIQTQYKAVTIKSEKKDFCFSVDSLEEISNRYGVDALILVDATDEISTAWRKAKGFLIGFINIAIENIVRVYGARPFYEHRKGITVIKVALVDKPGSILWHRGIQSEGSYDLRRPDSVEELMKICLKDFPSLGK